MKDAKMPKEMQVCKLCRFVKQDGEILRCRRYPPQFRLHRYHDGEYGFIEEFPQVLGDEWCGEFKMGAAQ